MDIRKIIQEEIEKVFLENEKAKQFQKNIEEKVREILSPIIGSEIEEIDLTVGGPGLKPGGGRNFPKDKKGGTSLNISKSDGPREFPRGEDF